jgi:hypothetical protein
MTYSRAKLESNGDKAFCIILDGLNYVSHFKHFKMFLGFGFVGSPNSVRMLCNTSFLTESKLFEVSE